MQAQFPNDTDWSGLARLFAGELPEEEDAALRRWIEADPERRELVAQLRDVWERTASLRQGWDAEAALHEIRARARRPAAPEIVAPEIVPFRTRQPTRKTPTRAARAAFPPPRRAGGHAWRAAAAVVILAGTAATWSLMARQQSPDAVAMTEVVTRNSQRSTLRFGDGTLVVLAPDSRLRYPEEYDRRAADVYLTGAAYFEVTHDARRPFRVHTEHGIAEDLGTSFDVRAYPGAEATEVTVAEGEVALRSLEVADRTRGTPGRGGAAATDSAAVVLQPGDLGTLDHAGAVTVRRVDVASRLGWTEGRLVFEDTPLRDVAAELARWYDLEIQVTDSALAAIPVTAAFELEPASQVLLVIASTVDANYERKGRVVTLSPKQGAR